jgi:hypothetical protein
MTGEEGWDWIASFLAMTEEEAMTGEDLTVAGSVV